MVLLTGEQFDRTRRLALELAGIELFDRHREVLGRRSHRLGLADPAALDALLDEAERGVGEARRRVIDLVTTKFTGFFRNSHHFDVAAEGAREAVRRRGAARMWSAGAATGEEPYSLGIASIMAFGRDDPPVSILATDVDEAALEVARKGVYAERALDPLDVDLRARFFAEAVGAGRRRVAASARGFVRFRAFNLTDRDWPLEGPFDVIMCRNVLMYFAASRRGPALECVVRMLAPDGVLILDPAEHLGPAANLFDGAREGVYSLRPARAARRPESRARAPR
jgi:chemotaxis protein methyltransferase CheR